MSAITPLARIIARALLAVTLAAAALAVESCGVTEPDQAVWQDVSAFSWPSTPGTLMRYKVEENLLDSSTTSESIERVTDSSVFSYNGRPMLMLEDPTLPARFSTHYLPMHDTLVTKADPIGAEFALVAPLDRGHEWIAAYTPDNKPALQARIIDRFSQLKLDGHIYSNVVVVQYVPVSDSAQHVFQWTRLFARDVGVVQTIEHWPVPSENGFHPNEYDQRVNGRTTLIETSKQ